MRTGKILPFHRLSPLPRTLADLFGHEQQFSQNLDRLARYLETLDVKGLTMDDLHYDIPADQPVLTLTRTFNAPRALVWKALSEPDHVVRWFGPHRHRNRVLEFDWRVGGKWQIETTTPEGHVIVFFGEYREIIAPETVTQTFSFDALPPGAYSLDTVVLEDRGERTVYRSTSILPDIAARDGMLASGMDQGVREGFARLDAILEDFKAKA
jgi:uncharacterized protein YndB with AHSA1/START domain